MTDVDGKPAVLIGIDWADKEHFYSALDPTGKARSGSFKQTQEDIAQWVNDWKQKFPNVRLIIAIETTRGALINGLMEYPEVTIYPINPAALASYRKSFRHGGGKNDRTDAKLILKFLQHDRDELRPLVNNSAETRELETLTIHRRSLVDERGPTLCSRCFSAPGNTACSIAGMRLNPQLSRVLRHDRKWMEQRGNLNRRSGRSQRI